MICNMDPQRSYVIYTKIGREDVAEEYKETDEKAVERRSRDLARLNKIFSRRAEEQTV